MEITFLLTIQIGFKIGEQYTFIAIMVFTHLH